MLHTQFTPNYLWISWKLATTPQSRIYFEIYSEKEDDLVCYLLATDIKNIFLPSTETTLINCKTTATGENISW